MTRDAGDRRDAHPADAPGGGGGGGGDDLDVVPAGVASTAPATPAGPAAPAPDRHAALLTAYVDGVAELPSDERHRIEALLADDPQMRAEAADVRVLLDHLRALPPSGDGGDEPDWAAMERSIRQAVAAEPTRPWWRSWRWLVPAMTFATAAAVLFAIWPRSGAMAPRERPVPAVPSTHDAPGDRDPAGDGVVALWLAGAEVEIDLSSPDLPSDVLAGPPGIAQPGEPDDTDEVGLLPATDLAWVDSLDAAALDRAERWLAGNKG